MDIKKIANRIKQWFKYNQIDVESFDLCRTNEFYIKTNCNLCDKINTVYKISDYLEKLIKKKIIYDYVTQPYSIIIYITKVDCKDAIFH